MATEISIAKDHKLNEADKKLLALYEEALRHYQVSADLWKRKIDFSDGGVTAGTVPIFHDNALREVAATYEIPVSPRNDRTGAFLTDVLPGDSMMSVWKRANETLAKATALYLGKEAITQ